MSDNSKKFRQFYADRLVVTREGRTEYRRMLDLLDAELPDSLSIVGNASGLFSATHGREIDARPTIRFNKAQIIDPVAQGTRWDIVATSNGPVLRHYREVPPPFQKLLFTPYLDAHIRALDEIGVDVPVLRYPLAMSRNLGWWCGARPTVGMQVLFLLAKLRRRDVHIFGFDWKATPTFYDPLRASDPHRHDRERWLARRLIRRQGWALHTASEGPPRHLHGMPEAAEQSAS